MVHPTLLISRVACMFIDYYKILYFGVIHVQKVLKDNSLLVCIDLIIDQPIHQPYIYDKLGYLIKVDSHFVKKG